MEYCIAQSHPGFTNSATNRMSAFLLLADEDTVEALGNAFYNDLVIEHEVYEITKTSPKTNFDLAGKFKCPGRGCNLELTISNIW
uniref:SERPIN domain-containing protein n=1 Tax=Rhabditophanes sp. KR3021 TaxID=114890 RepID=A0AC35THN6_9BILA